MAKTIKPKTTSEKLHDARYRIAALEGILARVCAALRIHGDTGEQRELYLSAYLLDVESQKLEAYERKKKADPF